MVKLVWFPMVSFFEARLTCYHPGKLIWQWKTNHLKMYLLLNMAIFHCHLSFRRGNWKKTMSKLDWYPNPPHTSPTFAKGALLGPNFIKVPKKYCFSCLPPWNHVPATSHAYLWRSLAGNFMGLGCGGCGWLAPLWVAKLTFWILHRGFDKGLDHRTNMQLAMPPEPRYWNFLKFGELSILTKNWQVGLVYY